MAIKKRKSSLKNAVSSPVKAPGDKYSSKTSTTDWSKWEPNPDWDGKDPKTELRRKREHKTVTTTPGGTRGGLGCRAQWDKNKEEIIAKGKYTTWEEFKPYCEGYVEKHKIDPITSEKTSPEYEYKGVDKKPCLQSTIDNIKRHCKNNGLIFDPTGGEDGCGDCKPHERKKYTPCSKEEIAAMKAECEAREPTAEGKRWNFTETTMIPSVQRSTGRWTQDYETGPVAGEGGECGYCEESYGYKRTIRSRLTPKHGWPKLKRRQIKPKLKTGGIIGACEADASGNIICPSGAGEMGGGVGLPS